MTQFRPRSEKSLAGRQTQGQATTRDKRTRSIVMAMLVLFVLSIAVSLSAFAYVFVLQGKTAATARNTQAGICALLAQAQGGKSASNITAAQRQRLAQDEKKFHCQLSPSSVRNP